MQQRPGEFLGGGVAIAGQGLERRTAGIRQAEEFGGFIEGFAHRVVQRGAEQTVLTDALDQNDLAVAAGE